MGSSSSKDTGLSGKGFKDGVREKVKGCVISLCTSLVGWRRGNGVVAQESQSSAFRFQPVWGLRAGGQHAANFFHLVGVVVSAKQLKNMSQDIINSP